MSLASILSGTPAVVNIESNKSFQLVVPSVDVSEGLPGSYISTLVWNFSNPNSLSAFPVGSTVSVTGQSDSVLLQIILYIGAGGAQTVLGTAKSNNPAYTFVTGISTSPYLSVAVPPASPVWPAINMILTLTPVVVTTQDL